MATTLTSATFSNTYKDDYLDSDGYYRILFNSGRTLQARELTQMQTIIQKQIERLGNNLFKEGAIIKSVEAGLKINSGYEFIKLNTLTNTLPTNYEDLIGTSFTGQTSSIVVKVLEVIPAEGSDPATLYVQYTNTSSSTASTLLPIRMQPGENIDNGSTTLTVQTTNTVTNPAVGVGTRFSIPSGIFYTKGHFVFTEAQSKIISKYTDTPNADVGFKIVEDIVTTADDTGLYDNQGTTPNISAPGADRYRIQLLISTRDEIDSDQNFIHIATVFEGSIKAISDPIDDYNIPNQLIAKRIYENSGDYIVDPFTIKFEEDSDANIIQLKVSDGIAVVEGYRAVRYTPTILRLPKAQETTTINNDVTAANFGNYVIVSPTGNTKGIPNINVFEQLNLRDTADYGGSTIGTCRVRAISEDGANYKYHLFDIQMNSGQAFRDVKSIGTSVTNYFNPVLESSKAVLKETANNTLLFPLPHFRAKSFTDISLAVQRRFATTTDGSGQATITLSSGGETFTNTGDWVFANADSDLYTGSVSVSGAGTAAATISGLPASSSNLEILAYVNKSSSTIRTKTLTSRSITKSVDSDGNGLKYIPLGKADVYDVTEIVSAADSSINYENRFTLDNGQRDNFYALGKLIVKNNTSAPAGNIHVKYRHFNHGTNGDFFAVNSYTGQVDYSNIPNYTTGNGSIINLRDYLDFRSVQDSDGSYSSSATGARISELPQPNDLVQADITYYLAQSGKLVINTDGTLNYVVGENSFLPSLPQVPERTLPLYNIYLGGNTLNDSDVITQKIDHPRYTMADIANLEKRIDKVEELASLSLLELSTTNFEVLDSAGLNRTKSGVVVDNFTTQSFSATKEPDYRASINPLRQYLTTSFSEDNIRLIYDSDASTNVVKRGDNIYLKYEEETYVNQTIASRSIKINPFAVIVYEGTVKLSPSSDEWRETEYAAAKVIDGGTKLNTTQAHLWGNWEWNWGGTKLENLSVGSKTNKKVTTSGNTTSTAVNKVTSDETIRKLTGDRIIDVALIPFMRSKKVFFKAEGLRPNSKVFAFFDGVSVANWVRSESFAFYSDNTTDYGNIHNRATAHPEGATSLQTDANGKIEGSFFIPNTNTIKFRTGVREFKILDISVNREQDAICVARGLYAATGYLDTRQEEYLSTRVLTVQGSTTKTYRNTGGGGGKDYSGKGVTDKDGKMGGKYGGWGEDGSFGLGNHPGESNASSNGPGGGTGCFLAGTLVTMSDGTKKAIETIELGESVAIGGFVFAKGSFLVEDLYDYKGIKVSGSHMVYEQGLWVRVRDSLHGVPEHNETVVVYNFGTENRRLLIEDVTFTDYFEISEKEKLETLGDEYFENWKELSQLSDNENERVLNS